MPVLGPVGRIGEVSAGGHQRVFGKRNTRRKPRRLVFVFVEVQFADNGFQQVAAVRGFVDGERLRIAYPFGVLAQNPRENRVERAHPDEAAAVVGQHGGNARAHLLGSLVRKGEGQNVVRLDPLFDHVGDTRGQHTRLARPGARNDKRRRIVVHHGVALGRIQSL